MIRAFSIIRTFTVSDWLLICSGTALATAKLWLPMLPYLGG